MDVSYYCFDCDEQWKYDNERCDICGEVAEKCYLCPDCGCGHKKILDAIACCDNHDNLTVYEKDLWLERRA